MWTMARLHAAVLYDQQHVEEAADQADDEGAPEGCAEARHRKAFHESRRHLQQDRLYSWWDYRMLAFPKNNGLRIDHILATPALADTCTACVVDRNERKGNAENRPSDHAPVTATFAV